MFHSGKAGRDHNYLECIPMRAEQLYWSADERGLVTLHVENKGFFHYVTQKVFRRPRVSLVKLDELGSFVWQLADGRESMLDLGEAVRERFGSGAEPLYERMAKYFQILDRCAFIEWK